MSKPGWDPETLLVSVAQMQAIEQCLFTAGMPVAALMENVARQVADQIKLAFPISSFPNVGLLIGAGHNGGDALVIARELRLQGRALQVWLGKPDLKPLPADHARYLDHLGVEWVDHLEELAESDLLIDGMFGIGLSRPLEDPWATAVQWVNASGLPVISVDVPSGFDTDRGGPLGDTCIRAHTTYCLGLWKRGLWQDPGLEWLGNLQRVDFGIPPFAYQQIFQEASLPQLISKSFLRSHFPQRPVTTYKYRQGHLLLICGSATFAGAAVLTALGARGSGVGMVSVAVPQSLKPLLLQWVPEALIVSCPETEMGGIASVDSLDLDRYSALALGPGMTQDCLPLLQHLGELDLAIPWVLDADGLNSLARLGTAMLRPRSAPTVLTPHLGEFQRLFPEISLHDRIAAVQTAAQQAQVTVLLKGARTLIADPEGQVWVNPSSTPALARGGTGDVLTGLIGGLLARGVSAAGAACLGAWWHSQAALTLEKQRGLSGVDPVHLADALAMTEGELIGFVSATATDRDH
jgi:NAD(P)H-hydrate epimerase